MGIIAPPPGMTRVLYLDGLVEGKVLVLDVAALPVVLLALLLLLSLVAGRVGRVAPPSSKTTVRCGNPVSF